jgi:peptidoglycan hydrolase-like protein with peptidoglycan-binding domain
MLCASKIRWAGIAFALLTTGMVLQARSPIGLSDSSKEGVAAFVIQNEIKKIQETLRDEGHYRGKVDGVVGLRTRAGIRAYQKAKNIPVTGRVDTRTADGLGVRPESIWGNCESAGHDVANGGGRPGSDIRGKPSAGIGGVGARAKNKTSRKVVVRTAAIEENGEGEGRQ